MLDKDAVTAVMSAGDADAKISLLKRAVVSATRERQAAAAAAERLRRALSAAAAERDAAREAEAAVRRRLRAAEAELEDERERGRRHMRLPSWRGLSSLVTGADPHAREKPPPPPGALALSPEDQEKIVAENEGLHMQLFDTKTQLAEERRAREVENAQREKEVIDLRAHLDAATQACDRFHAESARDATFAQFCAQFFAPDWAAQRSRLALRPVTPLPTPCANNASEMAGNAIAALRALQGGVAALFAGLRDALPPQYAHRCARDRLVALLDAHALRRKETDAAAHELFAAVQSGAGARAVAARQEEVLASADDWLALIALHARLIARSCADACATASDEKIDEEIDALGAACVGALSAARGAISVLRHICRNASAVLDEAESAHAAKEGEEEEKETEKEKETAEWLVALECFWWTGCAGAAALQTAAAALSSRIDALAETPPNDALRAALLFVGRALRSLEEPAPAPRTELPRETEKSETENSETAERPERDELLEALAAADRAAVCYHAQMSEALAELAETKLELSAARESARIAKNAADERADDAEREREALEAHIRILSERLVECNGGDHE